jgi:PPK2 family polyphosphate:nucleotide phosphotransferase
MKHAFDVSAFRVQPGQLGRLDDWPTRIAPVYKSRARYQHMLAAQVGQLSDLQQLLYASNQHALLLIFQAMDGAGKDGAIRHVMSGVNPQGCQVFSFVHPGPAELKHDFLWRSTRELPERGRIGIFNRSYYEEVLIVRVHPSILQAEGLPEESDDGAQLWDARFRSINDLESHLRANGTRVVKFFLHLSFEEQRLRFLQRIDDPDRNWKFSRADMAERGHWKAYMAAYEACLNETSRAHALWHVVPADDKLSARLIVGRIVLDELESLSMHYPKADAARLRELRSIRKRLAS